MGRARWGREMEDGRVCKGEGGGENDESRGEEAIGRRRTEGAAETITTRGCEGLDGGMSRVPPYVYFGYPL